MYLIKNISVVFGLLFLISACSKHGDSPKPALKSHADSLLLIVGNWQVVQDSLVEKQYNYHNISDEDSINVLGVNGDDWHFETDGTLNIEESNLIFATTTYELTNQSRLLIPFSLILEAATIVKLDSENLIFYWNSVNPSTGGFYYRKVILKR